MKTLFTSYATTIAGRNGHTKSDDGVIDLPLAMPGSGKPGTNPEQLFAAAYSACFGGAVEAVAKKENHAPAEVKVTADVSLNQQDDGYFIAVTLDVSLKGVDSATARTLVEKAHVTCPYSKATRGNVEVTLKVDGQPLEQKKAA